tara:strand:+ start:1069 stop:2037 length:969 start_codon:yes stop_codon:yes gene_type:complete
MSTRLTNQKLREKPDYRARILSPRGAYPSKSVCFGESFYIAGERICFFFWPAREPSIDEPYSEQHWLDVEETRAYGALMLAVDRQVTYASIYPYPHSVSIVSSRLYKSTDDVISDIEGILAAELMKPDFYHPGFSTPIRNEYRSCSDISAPPLSGGPPYDLRVKGIDYELALELHAQIDPTDVLALRGLNTWIKAAMLTSHRQFIEEATNTLYISLEASFRMVLRELRKSGMSEPTAKDAAKYIHDAFHDIHRLERYFEEDYEKRIISLHPENRFGLSAFPELFVDDNYHLFNDLQEVFRYLLVGYIHPEHLRKMRVGPNAT